MSRGRGRDPTGFAGSGTSTSAAADIVNLADLEPAVLWRCCRRGRLPACLPSTYYWSQRCAGNLGAVDITRLTAAVAASLHEERLHPVEIAIDIELQEN